MQSIRVFTTRPDTLFGATYMVLSPEHELVDKITTPAQRQAVEEYKPEVAKKSDLERTELAKEKTGVFTGAYAINPVNGEKIRSGLPITCSSATAPARSWPCRATTRATSSSPRSSTCPSSRSSNRRKA